jgi:hypothetical protein
VFFIPFTPPPFHFVTTLKGFVFLDENERQTEDGVAKIVKDTLFPAVSNSNISASIRRIIANYNDNIPLSAPSNTIDILLRYLRKSLVVERLNLVKKEDIGTGVGQSHPAWNVYIYPPTRNAPTLREWRAVIQETTFVTEDNDAGKTYKIFNCTICRSINHPSGMCPYPTQDGWIPLPADNSPTLNNLLNTTNRDNRDNRNGNRGRGSTPNNRGRTQNIANNRGAPRT